MRDPQPELVTGAEIGRRLHLSRERVRQLARSPVEAFPPPLGRIGPAVVWEWEAVAVWAETRSACGASSSPPGRDRQRRAPAAESPAEPACLALPGSADPFESAVASPGVMLFCDRASAHPGGFALTPRTAPFVSEICRLAGGDPLAIKLAAGRAAVLAPREIAFQLRRLPVASTDEGAADSRLDAIIDWSCGLLPSRERALLHRLSLFPAGCDLAALLSLGGGEAVGSFATLDGLAALVAKSLVVADTTGEVARYRLPAAVQRRAAHALAASADGAQLRRDHVAWSLSVAEDAARGLTGAGQLRWLERLQVEHENLLCGLDRAMVDADLDSAVRLAGALVLFWREGGHLSEGLRQLERVVAAVGGRWHRGLGVLQWGRGCLLALDQEEGPARVALEQALRLARAAGDWSCVGRALLELGSLPSAGPPAVAAARLDEAAEAARRAHDRWCLTRVLSRAALLRLREGRSTVGRRLAGEALDTARGLGDRSSLGVALLAAGDVALESSEPERAERLLAEAVAVLRELPSSRLGPVLLSQGRVAATIGDGSRADRLFRESLARSRREEDRLTGTAALCARGDLALQESRLDQAGRLFRRAAGQAPDGRWMAAARVGWGEVLEAEGRRGRAREHVEEALRQARWAGDTRVTSRTLAALARLTREAGEVSAALGHHHEALRLCLEIGDRAGVADSLEGLAGLAGEQGHWHRSARLFGAASRLWREAGRARPAGRRPRYESDMGSVTAALGDRVLAGAWREGESLSAGQAVAHASQGRGRRSRSREGWASLTRAEHEVAALVVDGLTNADIATRLLISRSTVEGHVRRIFGKLGVESRTQLARRGLANDTDRGPAR